jgi:hypothetical protein
MKETGPEAVPPEGEQFLRRADPGEVEAGTGAALEDEALLRYQLRIESIESSTARMKHAETCCGDSGADVEPDRGC